MKQYIVTAYSTQANQSIRQFNLEGGQNNQFTESEAKLWAESFAIQLNREARLDAQDWVGRVQLEEHGIHTYVDAMNSQFSGDIIENLDD
jgi:hypothetical protein